MDTSCPPVTDETFENGGIGLIIGGSPGAEGVQFDDIRVVPQRIEILGEAAFQVESPLPRPTNGSRHSKLTEAMLC
jgi:hypothetical protein